ncbi:hypothetical protein [Parvularcula marina]|uniref:hypothetical protein n=1 Tax=Parvularcula marina TaxID=2292771 RepID=UPI003510F50A
MSSDAGRTRITSAILDRLSGVEWTRGFLLTALLALSWWSTTQGLIGLITAANGYPGAATIITIGFAVAILTVLISWTLERLSSGQTGLLTPLFLFGYVLLTVISVGFGYGFYWKHIESHSAAQRAAEYEVDRLNRTFALAYGRLDESLSALDALATLSVERADQETSAGGTCGPETLAGPGPRYRLRTQDAATMTALRKRIAVQVGEGAEITPGSLFALRAELSEQLGRLTPSAFASLDEEGTRRLLKETEQVMAETATRYEAFRTGPSVHSAVTLLEGRIDAGQAPMTDGDITFSCPDRELDIIMSQAVSALSALPELPEVALDVPLGPDATVAAFGKFANTMFAPFRGKSDAKLMAGRDYIPLGVAIAIDLFILILSLHGRKPARSIKDHPAYMEQSASIQHLMGDEDDKPPHEELLNHTFWWRGAYYLAIPSASRTSPEAYSSAQRLTLAAMVLADAGLLTPLNQSYSGGQWREKLPERHHHDASRPLPTDYHLYRYKKNSLARMTALLTHGKADSSVRAETPDMISTVRKAAPLPAEAGGSRKPAAEQRIAGLMSNGNAWVKRRSIDRRPKK